MADIGTKCWRCANAVPDGANGCPWSKELRPVPGWVAEITRNAEYASYMVKACPMFVPDSEKKPDTKGRPRESASGARPNRRQMDKLRLTESTVMDYWLRDGM